jgi:hypothetical protein
MRLGTFLAVPLCVAANDVDIGTLLGVGHNHTESAGQGFGYNHMESVYTAYLQLPTNQAGLEELGWTQQGGCDPYMGKAWTFEKSGASKTHPLILYTTNWGAISGIATVVRDPKGDIPSAYRKYIASKKIACPDCGAYVQVNLAFRAKNQACSGYADSMVFGDRIVLNAGGKSSLNIPVTDSGLRNQGWIEGSCFDGMGTHWFYDSTYYGNPNWKFPWNPNSLLPIVAMYHDGKINAIFFNTFVPQASGMPKPVYDRNQGNGWESFPLPPDLMCANSCSKECTPNLVGPAYPGWGSSWATQHVYFRDNRQVKCSASLKCGSDKMPDGSTRNPAFIIPYKGQCCPDSYWKSIGSLSVETLKIADEDSAHVGGLQLVMSMMAMIFARFV